MLRKPHFIDALHIGGPIDPYYDPYYKTCFECSCGFSTPHCDSWQDAGKHLDEHLAVNEVRSVVT